MAEQGLVEVEDASERFVAEATRAPGSVVLCAMEGSRPLLVEVQALVAPSELVPPRRVANGVDRNRLALVLAVLARHGGLGLGTSDVFVSVAGGVRVDEPGRRPGDRAGAGLGGEGHRAGADGKPLAAFGELGLTGELRHVAHADRRMAEAAKFGLDAVVRPGDGSAHAARGAAATGPQSARRVARKPLLRAKTNACRERFA